MIARPDAGSHWIAISTLGFKSQIRIPKSPIAFVLHVVSLVSFVVNRLAPAFVWVGGPGMRPRGYRNLENASAHTWVAKRITLLGRSSCPCQFGFFPTTFDPGASWRRFR